MAQKIIVNVVDASGNSIISTPLTFKPPKQREVITQELLNGGYGVGVLLDEQGDVVTSGGLVTAGNYTYRMTGQAQAQTGQAQAGQAPARAPVLTGLDVIAKIVMTVCTVVLTATVVDLTNFAKDYVV